MFPARIRPSVFVFAFLALAAAPGKSAIADDPFKLSPFSRSAGQQQGKFPREAVPNSLGHRVEEDYRWRLTEETRKKNKIERWRSALEQDPGNSENYYGLGRTLSKFKRYAEAIQVFESAFRINPIDARAYYEIGACSYDQRKYAAAATALEHALWYDSSDERARRLLGYSYYSSGNYGKAAENLRPLADYYRDDFETQYWLGRSLIFAQQPEAGAEALAKAIALKPDDFEANFQRGGVLARERKFAEAIPNLEKAIALRPDFVSAKTELLLSYVSVGRFGKGFQLFPWISAIIGAGFLASYLCGIAGAWWLSFRKNGANFPSLFLSLLWLVFVFWGQVAFLFLPAVLPILESSNDLLLSILLPAMPLLLAATLAAQKQIWGEGFHWPPRFGNGKLLARAAIFSLIIFCFNVLVHLVLARQAGWHQPAQKAMVFLKVAFEANPWLAFAAICIIIPISEEILFRGFLFAALRRWWRARWVVPVTALLFALVHLDLPFLLPLFLLGLLLGWARTRSRSLGLPILIHVVNNCIATAAWTIAGRH